MFPYATSESQLSPFGCHPLLPGLRDWGWWASPDPVFLPNFLSRNPWPRRLHFPLSAHCPVPTAAGTATGQTKFDRQALNMQGDGELYRRPGGGGNQWGSPYRPSSILPPQRESSLSCSWMQGDECHSWPSTISSFFVRCWVQRKNLFVHSFPGTHFTHSLLYLPGHSLSAH